MANSNDIISGSVRQIADVKTVLGESVNTLSGLCKSTKINWWSKKKPVQFTGTRSSTWWKSRTQDCGINPYQLSSVADVINHCNGTENGWTYLRPNGSTYPYRLLDFQGYNHNARAIISNIRVSPTTVVRTSAGKLSIISSMPVSSDSQLTLADMGSMVDCYLGLYAKMTTGSTARCGANTIKLSANGGDAFELSTNGWTAGTWRVYPFITTVSGDNNTLTGTRYSCPFANYTEITVVATAVIVNITNVTKTSTLKYTATVTLTNSTNASVTVSNNIWRTRPDYEGERDPETVYDASGTIASQTIAANGSKTVSVAVTVTSEAASSNPILYVYFNNMAYGDFAYLATS